METTANEHDPKCSLECTNIEDQLAKGGLDPTIWLKVFKDELNITKGEELKYLTSKDIEKIEKHAKEEWQKNALKKIVNDDQDAKNEARKNEQLSNIKELIQQDQSVREHVKTRMDNFKVSPSLEDIQKKSQNHDVKKVMSQLEGSSYSKSNSAIDFHNLDNNVILKTASGGCALMGVYLHEHFSGLPNVKKTVLDLVTELKLKQPSHDVTYEHFDSTTRTHEEDFDKDIDLSIKSGKAALNLGYGGLGVEAHGSGSREREKENIKFNENHSFDQKREKSAFVPIAAIELTLRDVHLTQEAVTDLLKIEVLMISGAGCRSLVESCEDFFNTYGSHINLGLLHFGGIYKWIATYHSEQKTITKSVSNLLQTTLDGFISLGIAFCNKQFGIGVSGNYLSNVSDIGKEFSNTELSKVELQIVKTGGPPDVEDFHQWKHDLSCLPSTWALISREHFVGIWLVLENHTTNFKDSKRLGQCLESVWRITNLEYDVMNQETCIQCVKSLSKAIKILNNLSGDKTFLKQFIQENNKMQMFFNFLATSDEMNEIRNSLHVQTMWHFLVENLKDAHIPQRPTLTSWIAKEYNIIEGFLSEKDFPSALSTEKIDTVHTFISVLNTKFLPQMRTAKCPQNQNNLLGLEIYVTSEIAHICHCLLEQLKVTDIDNFVILLSALSKFQYDETDGFTHLVHLSDVEEFVHEFEPLYKEYMKCALTSSNIKKQALLIDIITSNITRYENQNSEKLFDHCYSKIESKLDDSIKSTFELHMKSSFYDWKQVKSDLKSLIRDETLPTKISMQLELVNVEEKTMLLSNTHLDVYTADFISFLNETNVINFFPERLQYRDVISISSMSSDNPFWFLLEKILMQNSSLFIALENHISSNVSSMDSPVSDSHQNITEGSIDFDFLNFLPMEAKEVTIFNPLDLIVSIFVCSTHFLKQTLASKLHDARLAIPILLPAESSTSLCFSFGILRQISISQRGSMTSCLECPVNVLSFMRLGRPNHSKSEMINNFLNSENHHTFFNHNAPFGRAERRISNGLVETTFVLPKNKEKLTMIFNLRGNSCSYSQQQLALCAMSTAIVFLVTTEHLLEYVTLINACRDNEHTIIVIALDASMKSMEEVKTVTENFVLQLATRKQIKFVILKMKGVPERRATDINKDLQKCLSAIHDNAPQKTPRQLANATSIPTDDNCIFQNEKYCAEEVMNRIPIETSVGKKDILPLQSDLLNQLSKLMKIMHKPAEYKTLKRKFEIDHECQQIRRKQLEFIPKLHPFMIFFLQSILSRLESESNLLMFSVWLKSFLEVMPTTEVPVLKVNLYKDVNRRRDIIGSKHDEYKIQEITFGFEHLLREMGQMYEAITEQCSLVDTKTSDLVKLFPKVPAKLLVAGLPFEMMNGELVHVPLVWVKAVFTELTTLLGDAKCLILSIIGTQSSGKSTLLNTMFGLQFPVGHGRVTKGAFVQLIKMNDTKRETSYDYILVIDTEGLRAPELGDKNYFRDNEFATFIIGLADINIVNIKGESSAEMNEVLQMVIYALLRLRIANARLNRKQSCVFMHHNVNVTDNNNPLRITMQKINDLLNSMTNDAADQLNIADIDKFADVIDFDPKRSVWYLPDLLTGKPPMMRVNPSYSSKVEDIKQFLLYKLSPKKYNFLTLSDITLRIQDIWRGILMEDFTFNFRNSVEIQAFTLMERKFHELSWELEVFISDFITEKKYELAKCDDEKDMNLVMEEARNTIPGMLREKYEKIEAEFISFISGHKYENTMNKYTQNFVVRIETSLKTLIMDSERSLDIMKDELRQSRMCEMAKKECEDEINRLASEFAEQVRKTDIEKSILSDKFNERWSTWTAKFLKKDKSDRKPLQQIIIELIRNRYTGTPDQLFMTEVEHLQNEQHSKIPSLFTTLNPQDIENMVHISIDKRWIGYIKKEKPVTCQNETINFTDKLYKELENYIHKLHLMDTRFQDIYMKSVLEIVDNKVREFNENKNKTFKFRLLPRYKALILKPITLYCVQEFTQLNDEYDERNSPQKQLDKYRETAWNLFNGLLNNKKEDLIAADFFINAIDVSVNNTIKDKLPRLIENEILKTFKHSKYELMKTVMIDLVEKKNFHSFEKYIMDASTFVGQWLVYYTNRTLFEKEKKSGKRLYDTLCRNIITEIFDELTKSINTVTTEFEKRRYGSPMSEWVKRFVCIVPSLLVSGVEMAHVSNRPVTDITNFQRAVLAQLQDAKKGIFTTVYLTDETSVLWTSCPYSSVFDKLWGCCENCPFCNEPCEHTDKEHLRTAKHRCRQHRPQGLGDVALDGGTGPLVTEVCNFLVQTDKKFQSDDGTKEYMYKDYTKQYDTWEISPSFIPCKYWIWFFNTYQNEIAKVYGAKPPRIPKEWMAITEEEAIKYL